MSDGASEAELLCSASRGDELAFRLLYEAHRTPIYRFACRMLGGDGAAEDVTQECFMSVLRRPEAFDPSRAALRTYLCGIARNLAFKHLRKRGQETTVDDPAEDLAVPDKDPLRQAIDAEIGDAVRRAVSDLPPLQREVVVLFEYEGLTLAETASVCGIDVGAVKSRLHRARERLRRSLAPFLSDGATVVETQEEKGR